MKLYDQIKFLLIKHPYLRDSDRKLQWKIWETQGYVKGDILTYGNFLNGKLVNPESCRRTRQKVQERFPELQASILVQKERMKKRKTKGTFIFREKIQYKFEGDKAVQL